MQTSVLLVPLFSACAMAPSIRGDGVAKTELREISGFASVEVHGALAVEMTSGTPWQVEVSADSNLLDRVHTDKRGDVLVVRSEGGFSLSAPMLVKIAMPQVAGVSATGASRVVVSGPMGPRLEVHASGASEVKAIGAVEEIVAEISGASTLDTRAAESSTVTIKASGASHASARAESSISAVASGASSITIAGAGKVQKHESSGASSITLNGAKLD